MNKFKINFFTEGNWEGQIPRTHVDMRNDSAWMCALGANHYPLIKLTDAEFSLPHADLSIIIIPKKGIEKYANFNIVAKAKEFSSRVTSQQEGPFWYFQDWPIQHQIWFYNILMEMDWIFAHNKSDANYYEGLLGKPSRIMPTLMIEDLIKNLPRVDRDYAMIGGNFCSWYGGFDSYIVAQEFKCQVYAPSMGRKIANEEQMENLIHLPYMTWLEWIKKLNGFKYGVHLMRTHAAGTFALNCSYLKIPCIGYKGLDPQELLHPLTTVDDGNLKEARELAIKLRNDTDFYKQCAALTKKLYSQYYSEKIYREKLKEFIDE